MSRTNHHSESMLVRGEELDRLLFLAGEVIIASSNQGLVYKNLQNLYNKKESVSDEILDASKDLAASKVGKRPGESKRRRRPGPFPSLRSRPMRWPGTVRKPLKRAATTMTLSR